MKNIFFTLSLIFILPHSHGQILTFSTNDTIQINIPTAGTEFIDLDINQDGINDIGLTKAAAGSDYYCSIIGLTDSADVLHQYIDNTNQFGTFTGWAIYDVTDSVVSNSSNWMALQTLNPTAIVGGGHIHYTIPTFPGDLLNTSFYLGVRFYVIGSDSISRFHYGCIDATLTQNALLIIHGWSYEQQPNTAITCTDSTLNNYTTIAENLTSEIFIYPNPSNTGILHFNKDINSNNVKIFSLEGKKISFEIKNNTIDISLNKKGLYLIKIEGKSYKYLYN